MEQVSWKYGIFQLSSPKPNHINVKFPRHTDSGGCIITIVFHLQSISMSNYDLFIETLLYLTEHEYKYEKISLYFVIQ